MRNAEREDPLHEHQINEAARAQRSADRTPTMTIPSVESTLAATSQQAVQIGAGAQPDAPRSPLATRPSPPLRQRRLAATALHSPITARGTLLLLLLAYLVSVPALRYADIVGSVLGFATGIILLLALATTVVLGRRLKKTLQISVGFGDSSAEGATIIESGRPTRIVIRLAPLGVPPLFTLTIRPLLEHGELSLRSHIVSGSKRAARYLVDDVVFPHRGRWSFVGFRIEFGDQFGCTRYRWLVSNTDINQSVEVSPPIEGESVLPVISSCERAGDMLSHHRDRQGDLLDVRQYQPSDGARRIIWKIFAKKGELVSRHPEASMTPEGQVVIFVPAPPADDAACSSALRYLRRLETLNLEIFCGCLGMEGDPIAESADAARTLLIESVWRADRLQAQACGDLDGFLASAAERLGNDAVRRILLFFSPNRFYRAEDVDLMVSLIESIQRRGITPLLVCVGDVQFLTHFKRGISRQPKPRRWTTALTELVFTPHSAETAAPPAHLTENFLAICAQRQWEVMMVS